MNSLLEIDIEILRLIQNYRIELLDYLFYWLSKSTYFVSASIIIYLGCIAFFRRSERFKTLLLRMVTMLSVTTLIVLSLKYTILRTRPFELYSDIVNLAGACSPSFPSGHTAVAFTVAFGLMFSKIKRIYYLPVLLWAIAVAYSRLALGVHFPTDILTSIILAFTSAMASAFIYTDASGKKKSQLF